MAQIPVIDLHCDLPVYLHEYADEGASVEDVEEIGAALPHLKAGQVVLQVMAMFSMTGADSVAMGTGEVKVFEQWRQDGPFSVPANSVGVEELFGDGQVGAVAAIENASGFCGEGEALQVGLSRLEQMIDQCGRLLYISMTHNEANRFGGGNASTKGIGQDGITLLQFMDGKKIAIDLSHTSDWLAHDILNTIDQQNLDVPVIASHSNFRAVFDHARNLPDEIAREIIQRDGLIGMNFLRAFMHPSDPKVLYEHLQYGMDLGGQQALCLGADFFSTKDHPQYEARLPFYFPEHVDASKYPAILDGMDAYRTLEGAQAAVAHGNVLMWMKRFWD